MLGGALVPFLARCGYAVKSHGRADAGSTCADLIDEQATTRLLEAVAPTAIVNLVGLTNVDLCEEQPNSAYLANVKTAENVANWIERQRIDCHLVHISTDHVYDCPGTNTEDKVRLTNCYAFSKYAGELAVKGVRSSILRTNFFGRSARSNRSSLTDWLFSALSQRTTIQVFEDIFFSPLSMSSVAETIELCIRRKPVGVFNLGSRGGMSKADFAFAFAASLNLPIESMTRAASSQVTFLKAYRPKDMCMDCARLENALGIRMPGLQDEINLVAEEYREAA
jgi:dTDP-4-dehydrorhamnose reductase